MQTKHSQVHKGKEWEGKQKSQEEEGGKGKDRGECILWPLKTRPVTGASSHGRFILQLLWLHH